jgi:5-hydroxyisourate hydrolase-like protein (transthyretin family)
MHLILEICAIALLFTTAAFVHAQNQASPRSTQPASTTGYRIAGTVVNAISGEPVRRATVAVLATDNNQTVESAETDSEGRFELAGLAEGKYPLTASKRGFLTAFYDQHDEGYNSAIVTGEGQETTGLVFKLVPGATLHGVITGESGDPVEGAKVMLFVKPHNHNPSARIMQASEAIADDTGAYEFNGLAAGEYLLAVEAEPWYALHRSAARELTRSENVPAAMLDVAYPVTFFDSTTDEPSATEIKLAGGGREEASISLHAVPALHLLVPTALKQDQSLASPKLQQSVFGTPLATGGTGFFPGGETMLMEFTGVSPGHYQLTQGDPPRIVELDATASQQIDPSQGTPTVTVSGTLRATNFFVLPENLSVYLVSLDDAQEHAPRQANCVKGAFTFDAVFPGAWELMVQSPGKTLSVSSIFAGKKVLDGNDFTVKDKPVQIEATVSLGEARVEGFAKKNGKALPGAMIVLVPRNPEAHGDKFRRDQSDSDGSFSLRDVAPGDYTVVAIEDGWELDWARPEVIGHYLLKGVAVTMTENSGKLLQPSEEVQVQSRQQESGRGQWPGLH